MRSRIPHRECHRRSEPSTGPLLRGLEAATIAAARGIRGHSLEGTPALTPPLRTVSLVLACAAALAAALHLPGAAPAAGPRAKPDPRPNVVVITTDDQTVESLRVMTNVRRMLVAKGTTFDNSFASFPLCCPSRATFLTGQYSHNHGVVGNNFQNGLARFDESNTLPVWLSRAGYATAFVGKYFNGYGRQARNWIPPGWSEWYAGVTLAYFDHTMNRNGKLVRYGNEEDAYQTDVYTRTALEVIRRRASEPAPFFLWLSYFAPHHGGPVEWDDPSRIKTPVAAPRHRGRFAVEPLPAPPSLAEPDVSDKPAAIRNRPAIEPEELEEMTVAYRQRLESLLAVDEAVGEIVATLRATGELNRTLLVFTSDNGFLEGQHRIRNAKEFVYEASVRVPLIVRGPGVPQGARLQQPVANVDLAPTIAEAAAARPGLVQDGRSLFPLFADNGLEWGRDLLLERGPGASVIGPRLYTAIRTPRFVYAEHATGERELYDLTADPEQLQSVHADPAYAGFAAELARRLTLLRDCAAGACRAVPALKLDTLGKNGCVRNARVSGADEPAVDYVEFLADGELLQRADDVPFEHTLPQTGSQAKVRALAVLTDGRRLTLDANVRLC